VFPQPAVESVGSDRGNSGGFQRFPLIERREYTGQPGGQHGLAGTRRTDEQQVVRAGRGNFQGATRLLLSVHIAQVGYRPACALGIRKLHAADLQGATDKLFKFLTGWMGGPQLYVDQYGHPMLRRRHMPFAIGDTERDQWLLCMNHALDDVVEDPELRQELSAAFAKVADHMRNREQ